MKVADQAESAAATAAWSSSWTATLAARSVRTTTRRTPPAAQAAVTAGTTSVGTIDDHAGHAVPRRQRQPGRPTAASRRAARTGPSRERRRLRAGTRRCRHRRCRRRRTCTTRREPRRRAARRRRRGTPGRRAGSRPALERRRPTPNADDTIPSMPLAPRLAYTRCADDGWPYHSTSRIGIDDDTNKRHVVVERRRQRPGDGRFGRPPRASQHLVDRRLRRRLGRRPRRQPPFGCGVDGVHQLGAEGRRVGVDHSIGAPLRIRPAAVRVDDELLGSAQRRQPLRQHLRRRRLAQPQRRTRRRGPRRTSPPAGARRTPRPNPAPPRSLRPGVSQHRPPQRLGEERQRRPSAPAPGDDHAPPSVQLRRQLSRRRARRPVGAVPRAEVRTPRWQLARGPRRAGRGTRGSGGPAPARRRWQRPRRRPDWRSTARPTPAAPRRRPAPPPTAPPRRRGHAARSSAAPRCRAGRPAGRRCRSPTGPAPGGPRPPRGGARPPPSRSSSAPRTGRPLACAIPRAKNPADRSSSTTCTRNHSFAANASASGVDREPGDTTASVTPPRASSSTKVAQYVACSVIARAAPRRRARRPVGTRRSSSSTGSRRRDGAGSPWSPASPTAATSSPSTRPAHGRSADHRTDLVDGADLLGETGGRAAYVGYSMGGRLTLHLALQRPHLVERVVLVGATGGLDTEDERAARRAADDALVADLERDGLDAFLERWLANPLFATLPPDAAAVEDRKENTVAGLADSLRRTGTGTQRPLWDELGSPRHAGTARRRRARREVHRAGPPPGLGVGRTGARRPPRGSRPRVPPRTPRRLPRRRRAVPRRGSTDRRARPPAATRRRAAPGRSGRAPG